MEDVLTEILPGKLYFVSLHCLPPSDDANHYFSIGHEIVYKPFFADFGPMSLANIHQFVGLVRDKLCEAEASNKRLVHVCSHDLKDRSNAAFLSCAFLVIQKGYSADDAFRPFAGRYPPLLAFRDASYGCSTFDLTVLDCLQGLRKAIDFQWYVPATFDMKKYVACADPAQGGMSWIIPGKLLAFMGPASHGSCKATEQSCAPKDYLQFFREAGILLVIRLNSKEYDSYEFIKEGVRHLDMYFPDGSCPPPDIIKRFLSQVSRQPGPVAVHCKAGLGRTGVLAGLFAMRQYPMTAREFMGWCRLARPGSILGMQQQFLCDMEDEMAALRTASSKSLSGESLSMSAAGNARSLPKALRHVPSPVRSRQQRDRRVDAGQGEWLVSSLVSGPQLRDRPVQKEGAWQGLRNLWGSSGDPS